jgi:hypothetical protein
MAGHPARGLGKELNTGHIRKSMLQNVTQGLALGRIPWSRSGLLSLSCGLGKFCKICSHASKIKLNSQKVDTKCAYNYMCNLNCVFFYTQCAIITALKIRGKLYKKYNLETRLGCRYF